VKPTESVKSSRIDYCTSDQLILFESDLSETLRDSDDAEVPSALSDERP